MLFELITKGLLNLIANGPLSISDTALQWHIMQSLMLVGDFRSPQNKTNLRPVAMGDDDLIPGLDHLDNMNHCPGNLPILVLDSQMVLIPDEGIPTYGNDGNFFQSSPVG